MSVCEIAIPMKRCSTMFYRFSKYALSLCPWPWFIKDTLLSILLYTVYRSSRSTSYTYTRLRFYVSLHSSSLSLSLIHSSCLPRSRAHATRIDSKGVLQLAPSFIIFRSFHSARWLARIFIGSPLPHQEWVTLFSSEKKILSLGEHVLVHLLFPIALRCVPAIGALP